MRLEHRYSVEGAQNGSANIRECCEPHLSRQRNPWLHLLLVTSLAEISNGPNSERRRERVWTERVEVRCTFRSNFLLLSFAGFVPKKVFFDFED